MNSDATITRGRAKLDQTVTTRPRRRKLPRSSLLAAGEPMIWLAGGALAVCLAMIASLLTLIFAQGVGTFWPGPLVQVETKLDQVFLGEVTRDETYIPGENVVEELPEALRPGVRESLAQSTGLARRRLFRTGNFEFTGEHFTWVDDFLIAAEARPEWVVTVERLARGTATGRFYGTPVAFEIDGQKQADSPESAWTLFEQHHAAARQRWERQHHLQQHEIGAISRKEEGARVAAVGAALKYGEDSSEHRAALAAYDQAKARAAEQSALISPEIQQLNAENGRYQLVMQTAGQQEARLYIADIVRAYPANRLSWGDKVRIYGSRWWEFLTAEPREANSEGGVYPAIFGTVCMTLLMSLAVVPFGVLAALYLREYAKKGLAVSAVRIAINNLAGVPSIVFGVFGLGFFCYAVGGRVDDWYFPVEKAASNPVFGKGGMLWASFTLALLTLPVVIVATEEALSAVPNSMREGSYACGAGKWQTIRRIVLPRAMPGIMTGMILAMARGAGEVAPLMLVGAAKIAPELAIDGVFPFVHPQRSFLHLGFHIYDVGFQSQNSEAGKPMVFTTTLLLIVIVALLNVSAIWLRTRLRRRFTTSHF